MANEEQLSILKQGVYAWNEWRDKNFGVVIDLTGLDLSAINLRKANLSKAALKGADLSRAHLWKADFSDANLEETDLSAVNLIRADLRDANLSRANLNGADLRGVNLERANLHGAYFGGAWLSGANLSGANLMGSNFLMAQLDYNIFGNSDLSEAVELESVRHFGPSYISLDAFALSKGKIPATFLKGCGLSDIEIEYAKLYDPELSNEEINKTLYKIYDLRAHRALQISPLFISYSHGDGEFVDKVGELLTKKGIRYWRDIHEMKAGRIEKQIDRAISQNRTVLLVLSENSLKSDWVEHEVRTARGLEKDMGRDILCPVALDDSWKSNRWPKRIMEQIMEYNILDFSAWEDDVKFERMFRKLIDGLELFYKG